MKNTKHKTFIALNVKGLRLRAIMRVLKGLSKQNEKN